MDGIALWGDMENIGDGSEIIGPDPVWPRMHPSGTALRMEREMEAFTKKLTNLETFYDLLGAEKEVHARISCEKRTARNKVYYKRFSVNSVSLLFQFEGPARPEHL